MYKGGNILNIRKEDDIEFYTSSYIAISLEFGRNWTRVNILTLLWKIMNIYFLKVNIA